MLLTDTSVVLQLTDHGLRAVTGEIDGDGSQRSAGWEAVFTGAIRSAVRGLLDHWIEFPLRELQRASYADGALVLHTCKGDRILDDIEIDDRPQQFRRPEAVAFMQHFERARSRVPRCTVAR